MYQLLLSLCWLKYKYFYSGSELLCKREQDSNVWELHKYEPVEHYQLTWDKQSKHWMLRSEEENDQLPIT